MPFGIKSESNFKPGVRGAFQRAFNPRVALSGVSNALSKAGSNFQRRLTRGAQNVASQALESVTTGIPPGLQSILPSAPATAYPVATPVAYPPPSAPAAYPPPSAPPAETATIVPLPANAGPSPLASAPSGPYKLPPGTQLLYLATNGKPYPIKNYENYGPQAGGKRRRTKNRRSRRRLSRKRR